MLELAVAIGLLALFTGSVVLGFAVRTRLPEEHRSKEALESIQLVMSLLVTFAALVLSLLTTSAKSLYDTAERDRVHYAGALTQLDQCLRNYGSGSEEVRLKLQAYTAAVIASTWPSESRPTGVAFPNTASMARTGPNPAMADLMNSVGLEIRKLDAVDPARARQADDCYADYRLVLDGRWAVIDDIYSSISTPFFCAVVFWLTVVFAGFGLRAPRNRTASVALMLGVAAVTSALVLVIDLDLPYEGFFSIPSSSMRAALAHMQAP
jgi:hypothetical protein